MLSKDIKNKVQSLWDRLWSGGHSNPITAIEQISYLLFMKRLEEFKEDVPDKYKWSYYREFKGEGLVTHIKENVFEYIKNDLSKEDEPFAKAMKDTSFIINKPNLLKDCIAFIDSIYEEIDKEKENNQLFNDIQGDVYEHLLKHTSEAGKNGQFRTPRHIIHFMAELLNPDTDGKICDIACGSGGFLVGAYQYLVTKNSISKNKDDDGLLKGIDGDNFKEKQLEKLKENTFYGFDIDQTMVRIGVMNLMMHGISKPNIEHIDTLSANYEELEAKRLGLKFDINDEKLLKNKKLESQYKYILANPPFTGKINSVEISENLDKIVPPKIKGGERVSQNVQSELMFLERIVYMLKKGGKAAVIVPEGVLFGSNNAYKKTRQLLMTDCYLDAVISLPAGVFKPYAGVKTSILFFTKGVKKKIPQVWFYELKSDGYTLDDSRRRLKDEPLPEAIKIYKNEKQDRKSYFYVPVSEIEDNHWDLSYNRYKDYEYEEQEYELPKDILAKLINLEEEIMSEMKELNNLIR